MPTQRLLVAALAAICVVAPGCAIGERPTLAEQAPTTDEASAPVIDRLSTPASGAYVATYRIVPSSTTDATSATVTRAADGTVEVTIGTVVYRSLPDGFTTTCAIDGSVCDDYANDARVSDLGVTHEFWGPAFERRLRTDSGRRIGTSAGSTTVIAGQTATCVAVTLPSSLDVTGTVSYCALDNGLLARYQGADALIELTAFEAPAG